MNKSASLNRFSFIKRFQGNGKNTKNENWTYFIAWKFRGMKILRFRGRVQKSAKLKCREKSFNGQPQN